MKDEIIDKLNNFLSVHNPLTEECHVVYLMVQIRKVLDRLGEQKYSILRFYCDWIVHISKDRDKGAIAEIVERIDQSIAKEHVFPETGIFIPGDSSALEFMNTLELKKDMESFFYEVNISNILFKAENWIYFLNLLIRILINQPITNPNRNIKSICFKPAKEGVASLEIEFGHGRGKRSFINCFHVFPVSGSANSGDRIR